MTLFLCAIRPFGIFYGSLFGSKKNSEESESKGKTPESYTNLKPRVQVTGITVGLGH